jgi:hypothetical protein
MRGEGANMMPGQAMREALARKHAWEEHGPSQWGYGVAIDLLALERRVAALERTNHDAAPAARVQSGSTRADNAGTLPRLDAGDRQEPVAFAVMSGGRSYDIYDTRGEAEAICRWLREDESCDIWRVVPLVPADATPPSHATHGECSVPPEGTQQPAITAAEWGALYQGTAVLLWEGHTREAGSEGSRNLLQIAATLKGLRERLEARTK